MKTKQPKPISFLCNSILEALCNFEVVIREDSREYLERSLDAKRERGDIRGFFILPFGYSVVTKDGRRFLIIIPSTLPWPVAQDTAVTAPVSYDVDNDGRNDMYPEQPR